MFRFVAGICICLLISGCGESASSKMSGDAAPPAEWAELTALTDSLRGVGMNAGMQQWDASMAEVKPEVMTPIVDAFAASTPPSPYVPAKKDAVVAAYKELIASASGDTDAFSKKYETLMAAIKNLNAETF